MGTYPTPADDTLLAGITASIMNSTQRRKDRELIEQLLEENLDMLKALG